jgi:hypothetical protein
MNRKLEKYIHEFEVYFDLVTVEDINFVERILERVWQDGYIQLKSEIEYEKDND